jgi:hypothetical protein
VGCGQFYHPASVGAGSVSANRFRGPVGPHRLGAPPGVRGQPGSVAQDPGGLCHHGPQPHLARDRHADSQSDRQVADGLGVFCSGLCRGRRRESGIVRDPPVRARDLRSAGPAAGGRDLHGRSRTAERPDNHAAVRRNGAYARQLDPRRLVPGGPQAATAGQRQQRCPLQHVRRAARRHGQFGRRDRGPSAAGQHPRQQSGHFAHAASRRWLDDQRGRRAPRNCGSGRGRSSSQGVGGQPVAGRDRAHRRRVA